MKWINAKPIRIFGAIGVFLACFCYAYVYYKHLYENGGILSVSAASQHPVAFVWQAIIVNIPIIIFLSLSFIVCRKKATDYLSMTLGNTIVGYVILGLFWEWCKRKSGSLWVGVLIHAIMDFRV